METLPILLLVIIVFFALFGKKLNQKFKALKEQYPLLKPVIYSVAIVLAIVTGVLNADYLVDFLIFGIWFLMFLVLLTGLVRVIDLFLKTSYYKYPGIFTLLFMLTYATALLLGEKS